MLTGIHLTVISSFINSIYVVYITISLLNKSCCCYLFIPILLYVDVAKEIERQKTFWCEKGKEIETE